MRWLEPNDAFEANGRTYRTVRPPLYDSPTTRGLLDTDTGVYWASDCFATTVPYGMADVSELATDDWIGACYANAQQLSPWLSMIDPSLYRAAVEHVASLEITAIASCHSPTITGSNVERAFQMLRDVIDVPPIDVPGQELLDMMIAMGEHDLEPAR